MSAEWNEDFAALDNRSSDPSDPAFCGMIDAIHEDGTIYRRIYTTPMGRMMSLDDGPIPGKGVFVKWRESEPTNPGGSDA